MSVTENFDFNIELWKHFYSFDIKNEGMALTEASDKDLVEIADSFEDDIF